MRRKKQVPIIQKPATAEYAVLTRTKPKVLQHARFDSDQAATAFLILVMSRTTPEAGWFAMQPKIHTVTRKDATATQ